jgi:SAM-dependent methyltransferase
MTYEPDIDWTDDEIVFSDMTPDTLFVFDRMTAETIRAVKAAPGERILDIACGRAIDALALARSGALVFGLEASDTMIAKAREYLGTEADKVVLVRGLAESLPFADNAFDKTVCKGAMDHFADIQRSMAEMTRVTRPGGRVIVSIANFESLTCRLGRSLWGARKWLTGRGASDHHFWEPPEDHNYKFDLAVLKSLMRRHCDLEPILGLSLLWGFPRWGALLRKLNPRTVSFLLAGLDRAARLAPGLSDVLVAVGKPIKP